jgi:hypothetical protein
MATTNCPVDPAHPISLLEQVKTASDGTFYVPPFLSSVCNRIVLRAGKPEDFWLRTGREIFYDSDNGTTPEVHVPRTGKPVKSEIRLGKQGGLVNVQVRDITSHRLIWAELRIERAPPVLEADFNFMNIATNSPAVLLPAAPYNVFLESYSCHGKYYFTDDAPLEPFTVEVGKEVTRYFSVDVRVIKPRPSSQNPMGKPCEP